jgi:WD40 repeat protein
MGSRMPVEDTQPRVFISYARSDGEQAANELRMLLEQQEIPIWQDRVKMEGGRDWWLQIEKALNTVEVMVMIMTPAALRSAIVRKEWRYARQQGVHVYPIKASPDLDFSNVPRWMSSVHWYDLVYEQANFLNDLNRPHEKHYVPFMVTDLPDDFVPRPHEFSQLRQKLLNEAREEPIAITAALRGAGGYGKTTMARALCHDENIQEAFDDGILWVTLGEQPCSIIGILGDLIYALSHEKLVLDTLDAATNRLSELLGDRDILFVIDDVWDAAHLKPLLHGGKRCARLITTRNERVLPSDTERIKVDAMQTGESVALLGASLEHTISTSVAAKALQSLARRLGDWPLLLKLVNGVLRDRIQSGESLASALTFVNDALDEEGLAAFDDKNAQDHHKAVTKTLDISLRLLTPSERERYRELAIFLEDVDIELATIQRFWQHTGGLTRVKTEMLCQRLAQLSLLLDLDLARRTMRLHDVVRTYLRHTAGKMLPELNRQFLASYKLSYWSDLPTEESYLWTHLIEHFIDAERANDLLSIIRDGNYLATKTHLYGTYTVETDITLATQHNPSNIPLSQLKRLFRGISHLLNQCTTRHELASTLHAYLSSYPEFTGICSSIEHKLARPFITSQHALPDQPPPALIRTLSGHTRSVNGCAICPSGAWIVSCSDDETLKIWGPHTGQELFTLKGHTGAVTGCAVDPSGNWIVSCSFDETLKIWNSDTGQELFTLKGHTGAVTACAISPAGDWIVSCSYDGTLKIWNTATGLERFTLRGHTQRVTDCAISSSGDWIISCSDDKTLKIWNTYTGQEHFTLQDHNSTVRGCAAGLSDGLLAFCSYDGTLKIWNETTGQERFTLQGAWGTINCTISSSGDCIVSCSDDGTLKIWNAQTGLERFTIQAHTNAVRDCAVSPSGNWLVSCSEDKTLKIWDAHTVQERLTPQGHTYAVKSCAVSPSSDWIVSCSYNGTRVWDILTGQEFFTLQGDISTDCAVSPSGHWIVTCSDDKTLKLWNTHTGQERLTLKGHTSGVTCCAISPYGNWIVSGAYDGSLKLWNTNGQERCSLKGHLYWVNSCAVSPTGDWIVSCSLDKTLKIWDANNGQERLTLKGHTGTVRDCIVSPSGDWIVSCSDDKTLKIWDSHSGQERLTLKGHTNGVTGCAFNRSGDRIISCANDGTLKLWDTYTGAAIAALQVGAPLKTCAFCSDNKHIIAGGESGLYFLRMVL